MTLSSLDTNILIYAANAESPEHPKALALLESALERPEEWILADQVLFEFYKALRNPRIFERPLDAPAATDRIRFLREETGFSFCCHELDHWSQLIPFLEEPRFPYQQTQDLLLGITLKSNGVNRFFTRNLKDFAEIGFDQLINPIDPSSPSNQQPRTKNKEQRTKNQEQRTKNKEPRTKNQEQRTKNQEPRTKNQEQRTKNKEPRTKNKLKS